MNEAEMDRLATSLAETRYPYQVAEILEQLQDPRDLVIVVAAALYRSKVAGQREGVKKAKDEIRARLGL